MELGRSPLKAVDAETQRLTDLLKVRQLSRGYS